MTPCSFRFRCYGQALGGVDIDREGRVKTLLIERALKTLVIAKQNPRIIECYR